MNNVGGKHSPQNEEHISRFRDSYNKLIAWTISRILAEKDLNRLLDFAEFYGELRCANFDGIYQDNELEAFVQLAVLKSKHLHLPALTRNEGETVLVASVLYEFGGHSKIVLNWMEAFREKGQHRLLVTRLAMSSCIKALEEQQIIHHLCASRGIELINEILAYCATADQIVLHT